MKDKKPTKDEILKAIENLEKNPHDRLTILTDIGVAGIGAVGAGAAAVAFGSTTATILFGLVAVPVAAPLGVVVGAAALGGIALMGAKRFLVDGTYQQGKKAEMLNHLKDELRETEQQEQQASASESQKAEFYSLLKKPLELDLLTAEDAQQMIHLVETGQLSTIDACKAVGAIVAEAREIKSSS